MATALCPPCTIGDGPHRCEDIVVVEASDDLADCGCPCSTSQVTPQTKKPAARGSSTPLRVYVAGPMTGLPKFNYPAFAAAAEALTAAGFTAINPGRRSVGHRGTTSWVDYMRASLIDLAECDGIATLDGWQDSRGAALEVHIAQALDLPVRPVADWIDLGDNA